MKCDIEQNQLWIDNIVKQKGIKESDKGQKYKKKTIGVDNKGYQYVIVKEYTNNTRLIKFLESGYLLFAQFKELDRGKVKDPYQPSVCGVGIIGLKIDHPQSHYLYNRWRDMLRRCYDEDCNLYHDYGGSGVTVCDEWKYFPNFVRDLESKENYEKLKNTYKNPNERYELDKDLIKKGNKVYCNEYTCIVPHLVNLAERNDRHNYNKEVNSKQILQFDFSFNFIKKYDSISDAGRELNHSNCSGICGCCKGTKCHALGYFWSYFGTTKSIQDAQKEIKEKFYTYYNSCNNSIKSRLRNLGIDLKQCGIKENE